MALSDTAIRAAKPCAKPVRMFDGGGLYLEVARSGGKWWRLKYRHDNKEKRLSLGIYPDVSLKAARTRRDETRKLIAEGIDPSADARKRSTRSSESAEHGGIGIPGVAGAPRFGMYERNARGHHGLT